MMMEYCFCTKEVSKPYININYWKRNKYFLEIHSHQFWQLIIVISGVSPSVYRNKYRNDIHMY